jgi:hypothetical protein
MEAWKARIESLVSMFHKQHPSGNQEDGAALDMEEFGGSSKAMRMLSGGTTNTANTGMTSNSGGTATTAPDSLLAGSSRSSSTSHGSAYQRAPPNMREPHKLSGIGEDDEMAAYSSTNLVQPHLSSGPSNSLPPLPHPPMDLIVIVSVPPPHASPSTAQLKIRVIKATLDFLIASLGKGDRYVSYQFHICYALT